MEIASYGVVLVAALAIVLASVFALDSSCEYHGEPHMSHAIRPIARNRDAMAGPSLPCCGDCE
jgi:hypothetical protein